MFTHNRIDKLLHPESNQGTLAQLQRRSEAKVTVRNTQEKRVIMLADLPLC